MSRRLDDLDPTFRALVFELIARCAEEGICLMIVDTLRTIDEQRDNLIRGVSWTIHSKHLPQPPNGLAKAVDVVPYELYTLARGGDKLEWNVDHPVWNRIGVLGEKIGLVWGGRWKKKDMGHFELKASDLGGSLGPAA